MESRQPRPDRILALRIASASIGFADIGETWSECDARYGKPARDEKYSAFYKKDGTSIEVAFDDVRDTSQQAPDDAAANRGMTRHGRSATGRAVEAIYTKEDASSYFSKSDVKALLEGNAGTAGHFPNGSIWESIKRTEKHEDYLRFDKAVKVRVYWEYVDGAFVARKVRVKRVDWTTKTRSRKSGDIPGASEVDF
ncbi:MAG TPA: hypothetical protein VMP11_03550 [Verrucomicrobiae bacterium]|nr:hypothetical protein [Verrucomicrobiae bacterium]